jgi:hypothetical protein
MMWMTHIRGRDVGPVDRYRATAHADREDFALDRRDGLTVRQVTGEDCGALDDVDRKNPGQDVDVAFLEEARHDVGAEIQECLVPRREDREGTVALERADEFGSREGGHERGEVLIVSRDVDDGAGRQVGGRLAVVVITCDEGQRRDHRNRKPHALELEHESLHSGLYGFCIRKT